MAAGGVATGGVQVGNQQMNRENQQQAANEAEGAGNGGIDEQANNNNIVIRGAYRRRVNHLVERLRNNFYNNVFGVGIISDNNNNNALRNQPGFNNLTRSLRLLNMIFPNRPILNVRPRLPRQSLILFEMLKVISSSNNKINRRL